MLLVECTKINETDQYSLLIELQLPVIITREDKFYVALAPDVDIVSQGMTIEQALQNLLEALELYFEDEDAIRPSVTDRPIITTIEAAL